LQIGFSLFLKKRFALMNNKMGGDLKKIKAGKIQNKNSWTIPY
jgi:hypothetical protein